MHWFLDPILKHYVDFEGRVGRQEYWMFILFSFLLNIVLRIIINSPITSLVPLALFVPTLALTARRLHDINLSAKWTLLIFAPGGICFGIILLTAILFGEESATVMSFMMIWPNMILSVIALIIGIYYLSKPTQLEINQYGNPAMPKVVGVAPTAPAATAPAAAAAAPVATDTVPAAEKTPDIPSNDGSAADGSS